jgi:hypothetical protein
MSLEMVVYEGDLNINISKKQREELEELAKDNLYDFRKLTDNRLNFYYNGRDVGRHYKAFLEAVAKTVGEAEGDILVKLFFTGEGEYEVVERYTIQGGFLEVIDVKKVLYA